MFSPRLITFSVEMRIWRMSFSRLVEMPVKLGNPIIESEDILQQGLHLSLHDAGLLSHLCIPKDRADRIEGGHQRGR